MDYESAPDFDAYFLKLTSKNKSKNKALEVRLLKKIGQILNNPSIGTPKRHKLKHARGSHVILKNIKILFINLLLSSPNLEQIYPQIDRLLHNHCHRLQGNLQSSR